MLPESDLDINKQEQSTPPYGREPSELLAPMSEYFAGILKERTRAESSSYLKSTNGNDAQFIG